MFSHTWDKPRSMFGFRSYTGIDVCNLAQAESTNTPSCMHTLTLRGLWGLLFQQLNPMPSPSLSIVKTESLYSPHSTHDMLQRGSFVLGYYYEKQKIPGIDKKMMLPQHFSKMKKGKREHCFRNNISILKKIQNLTLTIYSFLLNSSKWLLFQISAPPSSIFNYYYFFNSSTMRAFRSPQPILNVISGNGMS